MPVFYRHLAMRVTTPRFKRFVDPKQQAGLLYTAQHCQDPYHSTALHRLRELIGNEA